MHGQEQVVLRGLHAEIPGHVSPGTSFSINSQASSRRLPTGSQPSLCERACECHETLRQTSRPFRGSGRVIGGRRETLQGPGTRGSQLRSRARDASSVTHSVALQQGQLGIPPWSDYSVHHWHDSAPAPLPEKGI